MNKKTYTVRDQFVRKIIKFIQNREYEFNKYEYFADKNVGEELEEEFDELITDIEYYYQAYKSFDYVTFTNRLPKHAKKISDMYEVDDIDMVNPFIEKEPIVTCESSIDDIGGDFELEFYQSELHG